MERFRLVRGSDMIGIVTHTSDERVDGGGWDVGWLEPAPGYEAIRHLFEEEQCLFDEAVVAEVQTAGDQHSPEWVRLLDTAADLQREIMQPGVWLVSLADGRRREVGELHIDGGKATASRAAAKSSCSPSGSAHCARRTAGCSSQCTTGARYFSGSRLSSDEFAVLLLRLADGDEAGVAVAPAAVVERHHEVPGLGP
jgi:hypothetical protein